MKEQITVIEMTTGKTWGPFDNRDDAYAACPNPSLTLYQLYRRVKNPDGQWALYPFARFGTQR